MPNKKRTQDEQRTPDDDREVADPGDPSQDPEKPTEGLPPTPNPPTDQEDQDDPLGPAKPVTSSEKNDQAGELSRSDAAPEFFEKMKNETAGLVDDKGNVFDPDKHWIDSKTGKPKKNLDGTWRKLPGGASPKLRKKDQPKPAPEKKARWEVERDDAYLQLKARSYQRTFWGILAPFGFKDVSEKAEKEQLEALAEWQRVRGELPTLVEMDVAVAFGSEVIRQLRHDQEVREAAKSRWQKMKEGFVAWYAGHQAKRKMKQVEKEREARKAAAKKQEGAA